MIGAFGGGLYAQSRRARFGQIDAELLAGARVLEGVLRAVPLPILDGRAGPGPVEGPGDASGLPPPMRDGRRPPPWLRGPRGRGDRPFRKDGRPPFAPERLPEDDDPDDSSDGPPPVAVPVPPGSPAARIVEALSLPDDFDGWYRAEGRPPYFAVWLADGRLLRAGPGRAAPRPDPDVGPGLDSLYRSRRDLREVTLMGPGLSRIVVGRSIERELAELDGLAWRIGATGLALFATGLLGGWWLSARAVRPIAAMSETVAGITARNLSRRIDVDEVDAELGDLGALLNVMLDRLEDAFTQQVRFVADASHELRTPLAVLLSRSELALSRPRTADDYRDAIVVCRRAGLRMAALVDDLLTLARVDAGKLEIPRSPVDLAAVAAEGAEMLAGLAEARGVRLVVASGPGPVRVQGDPGRLAQVVANLIGNAIAYNRPGGTATVTVAEDDAGAVLTVADTGIGIAEEHLPRLFDRFYRVDPSRSRDATGGHGGSGLGLAICRGIVEAHGGTIAATSREGAGTTFTVRLPRPAPGDPTA